MTKMTDMTDMTDVTRPSTTSMSIINRALKSGGLPSYPQKLWNLVDPPPIIDNIQYTWLAHNSLWNIFGDITLLVARGVVIMLGQVQLRCQPGPMGGRSQLSLRGDIEGRQERGYKPEARCRTGTSSYYQKRYLHLFVKLYSAIYKQGDSNAASPAPTL